MRNKKLIVLISVISALVLVIIVCGATFLVREVEAYSYYVTSPPEYDQKVIDAAGIKKNTSMFFVDERDIIARIESAYPEVGVKNIERKFPDRVSINYVVYSPSFMYRVGDTVYQCNSSGKIGGSAEIVQNALPGGYFLVKPRDAVSQKIGTPFQNTDGYDYRLITAFISYMKSITPDGNDRQIPLLINFVDLTRDGYFYIRTQAGCSIEVQGTGDNFYGLLDNAWSIFSDPDPMNPINQASGTIRAYKLSTGEIRTTYSAEDGDGYYITKYVKA
ncbi:MAG: FtsQ-type POTRA domain-containing protein [Clostridiales bacterium]|nr:FtsQ-type POTRA domain-containing protein [Clostridiales bacterium]